MPEQAKDRIGRRGERIARRFLRWRRGCRIVAKNWRPGRLGELDIVALDGQVLVFVEVKAQAPDTPTIPEDAVDPEKQRRIRQLAECFMSRYQLDHLACRFDVVTVVVNRWPWPARVTHYADAF